MAHSCTSCGLIPSSTSIYPNYPSLQSFSTDFSTITTPIPNFSHDFNSSKDGINNEYVVPRSSGKPWMTQGEPAVDGREERGEEVTIMESIMQDLDLINSPSLKSELGKNQDPQIIPNSDHIYFGNVPVPINSKSEFSNKFISSTCSTVHYVKPKIIIGNVFVRPSWKKAQEGIKRWQFTAVGYVNGNKPLFMAIK